MNGAVLRIVVVLYRARLSRLRPLLERVIASKLPTRTCIVAAINKDARNAGPLRCRHVAIAPDVVLEVQIDANVSGVTGAYNRAIAAGAPQDVLVLLDADSRVPDDYFAVLWRLRPLLASGLNFVSPELHSGSLRASPYALRGIVPRPITQSLDRSRRLQFSQGIGVINACLAGSIASFRAVNGFSPRINLDLSDVLWSIRAAGKGASLSLLSSAHAHDLSMLSAGFTGVRLRRYLTACWRLARETGDFIGGIRLAARGARALRWRSGRQT